MRATTTTSALALVLCFAMGCQREICETESWTAATMEEIPAQLTSLNLVPEGWRLCDHRHQRRYYLDSGETEILSAWRSFRQQTRAQGYTFLEGSESGGSCGARDQSCQFGLRLPDASVLFLQLFDDQRRIRATLALPYHLHVSWE